MSAHARIHKSARTRYAAIPNVIAQSRTLSPSARAVLIELLSRPDDWETRPDQLAYEHLSLRKVYRVLNELIDAGYVERRAVRGDEGKIAYWQYDVFDEPLAKINEVAVDTVKPPATREKGALRARTHFVAGVTHTKTEETLLHKAAALGISVVEPQPERPTVFDAYTAAFGLLLTPMIADELKLLVEEYTEAWVVDAMKMAAIGGKRSLGYAKGILRRWQAEGRDGQQKEAPDLTDDQRAMRAAQLAADEAAWLAENRNWS